MAPREQQRALKSGGKRQRDSNGATSSKNHLTKNRKTGSTIIGQRASRPAPGRRRDGRYADDFDASGTGDFEGVAKAGVVSFEEEEAAAAAGSLTSGKKMKKQKRGTGDDDDAKRHGSKKDARADKKSKTKKKVIVKPSLASSTDDEDHSMDEDGDVDDTAVHVDDRVHGDGDDASVAVDKQVAFADAMGKLLAKHVVADKNEVPILAKDKSAAKRLDSDRLLRKAERLALIERKLQRDRDHHAAVNADPLRMAGEIRLRKVATRGVVKLFNAIRQQQAGGSMLGDPFAANASGKSAMEKSKAMFGELLKGTARSSVSAAAAPVVVASSAASAMTTTTVAASTTSATAAPTASWDVLSDQYLMGAGFKDWDKAAAE